jgi:hypothetical protein
MIDLTRAQAIEEKGKEEESKLREVSVKAPFLGDFHHEENHEGYDNESY